MAKRSSSTDSQAPHRKKEKNPKELLPQNSLLEGINRIFHEAITCDSEEKVRVVCLSVAEDLTGSKMGFIGEMGEDGQLYDITISDPGWELCTMHDKSGHRVPPERFKIHGLYGEVIKKGRSLLSNQPASHPQSIGLPPGHPPLTAFLGVPLKDGKRTIGLLAVGNRKGGYAPEHQRALEGLAPAIVQALLRKRAEEETRRLLAAVSDEKEKLSSLINSMTDEVWFADANKVLTLVNPTVLREFGTDVTEGMGVEEIASNAEVYRPDGTPRPVEEAPPLRALAGEIVTQEEIVRTPATGELRHRQVKAAPVKDANGNIVGVVSLVRDITERKRMEEELAHLASFPQFNPNPVIEVDLAGNVCYLNPTAQKLLPDLHVPLSSNSWRPDFDSLIERFKKNPELIRREIRVGESWYQQSVHYIEEMQRIRFYWIDITERKKVEDALRESEERFRIAQELSPDGFTILHPVRDAEGNVVDFTWVYENETIARLNGTDPKVVIGRRLSEFLPTHASTRFHEVYKRVTETGKTEVLEDQYEGDSIVHPTWFRVAVVPMIDDIAVLAQDITERKKIELELQRSEEQLRSTLREIETYYETAPIGLCILDADLRYIKINKWLADINGIPADAHLGRTVGDIVPSLAEQAERIARHIFKTGDPVKNIELTGETAADPGTIRSWREDWYPIKDDDNRVVAINVVAEDITERKTIQEALAKSEERFRSLFETMTEGFALHEILVDSDGEVYDYRFLDANPGFEKLTGLKRADLIGHTVREVMPGIEQQWIDRFGRVATTGQPDHFENYSSPLDAWYEVLAYRPAPGQFAVVFSDITDRKRIHDELQRAKEGLELRVQERTAELQKAYDILQREIKERARLEEQMRQTQKMEALGTLAGGIAHDFNNMLAVILGNAELALDDINEIADPGGGTRGNIEQIIKASKRSRDLVKQILQFSRKDVTQSRKPLKLVPLLNETVALLRGSIPSTIAIDMNITADSQTILGDPSQIQQVLMNLASNAAYAMGDDGGDLTLHLSNVTFHEGELTPEGNLQLGRYVKLSVSDTGAGMSEEVKERIFDPFFTTKGRAEGTGMGLAVAFGIIKSHDGAITVESKEGQGSTFNLFFPAYPEQQAEEARYATDSIPTGTERILLVDDEPSVLDMVAKTLRSLGYKVITAQLGAEAFERFREDPDSFDLIITDHVMPEMTGIRLAEKVQKVRKDIPVILFTGYSDAVTPDKAKQAGIKSFVMKPVVKKELAEVVRTVLDDKNIA